MKEKNIVEPPVFSKAHAQQIIEAHEISLDQDDEETQLLEDNNPDLFDAYKALIEFANTP